MRWLSNRSDEWFAENVHVTGSSSWDHFYMDGNKYKESYFNAENGEFLNWRKGTEKGATKEEIQLFHDVCDNKYPKVAHLACHKSFNDVKRYYRKIKGIPDVKEKGPKAGRGSRVKQEPVKARKGRKLETQG